LSNRGVDQGTWFAQRFTEVSILADLLMDKDNKPLDTFSEAGKSIFVAACLLAIQHNNPRYGLMIRSSAGRSTPRAPNSNRMTGLT